MESCGAFDMSSVFSNIPGRPSFDGDIRARAEAEKSEDRLVDWTDRLSLRTGANTSLGPVVSTSWENWVFDEAVSRTIIVSRIGLGYVHGREAGTLYNGRSSNGDVVHGSPAVAAATAKNELLSSFDVTTSIRAKGNEISQLQDNPIVGANEVYIFSLVAAGVVLNLRSCYFPIRSLRELIFVSEVQCPIATPHFEDFIIQVSNSTDYINEASSWLRNSGEETLGSQQRKGSARS
jgi:hypothetical protein